MTGGLIQLVAYGAQDVYLTGNPQITFFKIVYRRYTNFAIEGIECNFSNELDFGKVTNAQITKNGDLISKIYLKTNLKTSNFTNSQSNVVNLENGLLENRIIDTTLKLSYFDTNTNIYQTDQATTYIVNILSSYKNYSNIAEISFDSIILPNKLEANDIIYIENNYYKIIDIFDINKIYINTSNQSLTLNQSTINFYKSNNSGFKSNIGYSIIDYVEFQIGGSKIDKLYGHWMEVWDKISLTDNQLKVKNSINGNNNNFNDKDQIELFIPLNFFCSVNYGLALPLIALLYHDVRIEIELIAEPKDLLSYNCDCDIELENSTIFVDYIYLNTEERKKYAASSHEYLIQQVQYNGTEQINPGIREKFNLNFNHPIKELIWATITPENRYSNLIESVTLKFNNQRRFNEQNGLYFTKVQPYQYHKNICDGIYIYSFSINPEKHQPSGTCNFSRLDSVELDLTIKDYISSQKNFINIYAINYNILRITGGMGGIAFSN